MTGQPRDRFPDVVLKELLDNALDAAENAGVQPHISVLLRRRGRILVIAVRDNGNGILPDSPRERHWKPNTRFPGGRGHVDEYAVAKGGPAPLGGCSW